MNDEKKTIINIINNFDKNQPDIDLKIIDKVEKVLSRKLSPSEKGFIRHKLDLDHKSLDFINKQNAISEENVEKWK